MNGQVNRNSRCKKVMTRRRRICKMLGWTAVLPIFIITAASIMLPKMSFFSNATRRISYYASTTEKKVSSDNSDRPQKAKQLAVSPETSDNCDWKLILVNRWNPLPDNYSTELTELSNGQSVDSRIYHELQNMFDAARKDGVYPVVVAGYRTAEKQQRLMDKKIAELIAEGYSNTDAKKEAVKWVAIPGTSEHQLGLAIDINADGIHSAGYEVYNWLAKNAHYYGFIRRYPDDKTDITGIYNEPWHYRYVGVEAATKMYETGLCLEEYLDITK